MCYALISSLLGNYKLRNGSLFLILQASKKPLNKLFHCTYCKTPSLGALFKQAQCWPETQRPDPKPKVNCLIADRILAPRNLARCSP